MKSCEKIVSKFLRDSNSSTTLRTLVAIWKNAKVRGNGLFEISVKQLYDCVKTLDSLYSIHQCQILVNGFFFFFFFFAIKTSCPCVSRLMFEFNGGGSEICQHCPENRS